MTTDVKWETLTIKINEKERTVYVSNYGDVEVERDGERHALTKRRSKHGYIYVAVAFGGFSRAFYVHRLVACAFLKLPLSKLSGKRKLGGDNLDVCHRNCQRDDNRVVNLYVASHKENCNSIQSRLNYQQANRRFQRGYSNLRNDAGDHFDDWHTVADMLNRPVATVRANIRHAIQTNGTAYGYKWMIDKDESWYAGKFTKYYRRADGTRPYIDAK